jgi:hypothetical protein
LQLEFKPAEKTRNKTARKMILKCLRFPILSSLL